MQFGIRARVMLGLILSLAVLPALADPIKSLVTDVEAEFLKVFDDDSILDAAKTLFVSLALASLVWTMGLHVVRQDLGDVLMELLRFMIATGTLYWLLINASNHGGGDDFVQRIVGSFYQMGSHDSGGAFRVRGNSAVTRALHVYMKVMDDTSTGQDADRIVGGIMGVTVLVALTLLAAQFLLALVMAWLLGYGGIFLLGFGGARWTSQIAINYYKHVVALGVAILALGAIGLVSEEIFSHIVPSYGVRTKMTYVELGLTLAVSLLMLVLGLRVPQLLYTLVTGSSLGMFAGVAGMAGSAIATGGGAALASAGGRYAKGGSGDTTSGSGGSVTRSSSAMEAIGRSAVSASAMGDPFSVIGGSDPFGASRKSGARCGSGRGSVFGATSSVEAAALVRGDGLNGSEPSDSVTSASSTAVAGAGSSTATIAAGQMRSDGQVGSGWQAGLSGETARNSLSPSDARDGLSRPDYRAEMSAIAAARADESAYVSAALDQAEHSHDYLSVEGWRDVKLSMSTSASDSADVMQAAPLGGFAPVVSSLTQHDAGQTVATTANEGIVKAATQVSAIQAGEVLAVSDAVHDGVEATTHPAEAVHQDGGSREHLNVDEVRDVHSLTNAGKHVAYVSSAAIEPEVLATTEDDVHVKPHTQVVSLITSAVSTGVGGSTSSNMEHVVPMEAGDVRSVGSPPGTDEQRFATLAPTSAAFHQVDAAWESSRAGAKPYDSRHPPIDATGVEHAAPQATSTKTFTSLEVDGQHRSATSQAGTVHLTSGSSEHRIDAMGPASMKIHQDDSPVERRDVDATLNGSRDMDTSEADGALAPPETGYAQDITFAQAEANHTSPTDRARQADGNDAVRRAEAERVHAESSNRDSSVALPSEVTPLPSDHDHIDEYEEP
jgi:P-type conjugative transfer protein TrbL